MIELPEVAFDLQQLIDEVLRVTYQPCVWQRPWQGPCWDIEHHFSMFIHLHLKYLSWNFRGRPDVLCSSLEAEPARTTGGCLMKGVEYVLFLYHCWVPDVFLSLCCSTCLRLIWLPVLAQEGPLSVGIAADDFATAAKAEFPKWNTMENWKGYFLA